MSLMLREPTQIMNRFQDEFNHLFRNFGERSSIFPDEDSNVITSEWIPTVDIVEDENEFVISADIPGVKTKDIEISMNDGILSIRANDKRKKVKSTTVTIAASVPMALFIDALVFPTLRIPKK